MSQTTERAGQGYALSGTALELDAVVHEGTVDPAAKVRIPLGMLNRHGFVAGATGTGKTKTLRLIAEQLAAAGVAVFTPDIKGDLSGLVAPGAANDRITQRVTDAGESGWAPTGYPTEFFVLDGTGTGIPIRATVTSFGPILMSKVLGLNDTQESALSLIFHWSDQQGLALLDLADLRAVISYLSSDEGVGQLKDLRGVAKAAAGVILRRISELAAQGAEDFFGEPELDTADLLRLSGATPDAPGRGIINLLELADLQSRPALFSTFRIGPAREVRGRGRPGVGPRTALGQGPRDRNGFAHRSVRPGGPARASMRSTRTAIDPNRDDAPRRRRTSRPWSSRSWPPVRSSPSCARPAPRSAASCSAPHGADDEYGERVESAIAPSMS